MKLTPKIIIYKSDSGEIFRLRFGKKALTFECLEGQKSGKSQTVFYETVEIAPKEHFISWLSPNNGTVRMVINFKKKTINYNYLEKGIRRFSRGKLLYFGLPTYANGYRIQKALNWILFRRKTNGI